MRLVISLFISVLLTLPTSWVTRNVFVTAQNRIFFGLALGGFLWAIIYTIVKSQSQKNIRKIDLASIKRGQKSKFTYSKIQNFAGITALILASGIFTLYIFFQKLYESMSNWLGYDSVLFIHYVAYLTLPLMAFLLFLKYVDARRLTANLLVIQLLIFDSFEFWEYHNSHKHGKKKTTDCACHEKYHELIESYLSGALATSDYKLIYKDPISILICKLLRMKGFSKTASLYIRNHTQKNLKAYAWVGNDQSDKEEKYRNYRPNFFDDKKFNTLYRKFFAKPNRQREESFGEYLEKRSQVSSIIGYAYSESHLCYYYDFLTDAHPFVDTSYLRHFPPELHRKYKTRSIIVKPVVVMGDTRAVLCIESNAFRSFAPQSDFFIDIISELLSELIIEGESKNLY